MMRGYMLIQNLKTTKILYKEKPKKVIGSGALFTYILYCSLAMYISLTFQDR